MRRTVSICVALVVLSLIAGLVFDASAQSIKIKRVGISANYAKTAYPGKTWTWQISNGVKAGCNERGGPAPSPFIDVGCCRDDEK